MKKIMKKVLSVVLALAMVITLAPMTANAEEQTLSVASGSATIDSSWSYEEVSFKAPGNGVIKVSLAGNPGWDYAFFNDSTYYQGDWLTSSNAENNNLTYNVSAGNACKVVIYAYDPATGSDCAGSVIYDIQFIGEVVEGADEPTGTTASDAIPLEGTMAFGTATAGTMTYFKVTVDSTKNYTVNIQDRFGSAYSLYYVHPMMGYDMWIADSENGAVTTTMEAGMSEYVFGIYNTGLVDASLMFTLTEGVAEEEKPALVVGENSVPVVVEGYWCAGTEAVFTAPETNTYVINPAASEAYADVYAMAGEYDVTWIETYPYEFTLAEGESLTFLVCTMDYMYDYKEDTVELVISVKEDDTETVTGTGTQDDPYTMIIGDNTVELEVVDDEKYYVYTATEAGALYLTMVSDTWFYDGFVNEDSDPFLNFNKSYNTTSNDSGDADPISLRTLYLKAGDVVKLRIRNAKNADWERPAGTVVFNAWFNAGETEDGGDVVLDEYVVDYDTMLVLGENNVELDPTAYTTIFEFCPDEAGVYKFETSEGLLLGYWGAGSFFVSDQTENKTNTLSSEITAVGQSIMLGVTGEGSCTVIVTKEGEYVDETVKIIYENLFLEDVKDFVLDENAEMVYIDVTDGKDDVTYLGEDGYIHLNSETGPIVYAQVGYDSPYVSIPMLLGYQGIATSYVDEETGATVIMDFTDATIEYVGSFDGNGNYTEPLIESVNGFVPLTVDLMLIIMAAAEGQMWFEPSMNNYYFDEGTEFDSEPWLFICAYEVDPENDPYEEDNNDNTGNDDSNTGNEDNNTGSDDEIKNTGDMTVVFVSMILFLGAAIVLAGVVSKKRLVK